MLEKHPLETTTAFTIRRIRVEMIQECISAIQNHYGFSDDEKRIATAVLHALEPSFASVGSPPEVSK